MDVVVLHNPRSGRGLAARLADRIAVACRDDGHRVKSLAVGGAEPLDPAKLARAQGFVVIGGDGTVSRCAPAAIQSRVPLYHVPTGNENLFARALGMARGTPAVLDALRANRTVDVDAGLIDGVPFLLMASAGADAGVIHRVAAGRTRAIGHLAYIEPILREAARPALSRVTLEVDGRVVVEGQTGIVLVANTRHYAARLDPCHTASLRSGLLHALFLPASTTVGVLRWAVPAWTRRIGVARGARAGEGRRITVRTDPPAPVQVDGEPWIPQDGLAARGTFQVTVLPGALRVFEVPSRATRCRMQGGGKKYCKGEA